MISVEKRKDESNLFACYAYYDYEFRHSWVSLDLGRGWVCFVNAGTFSLREMQAKGIQKQEIVE